MVPPGGRGSPTVWPRSPVGAIQGISAVAERLAVEPVAMTRIEPDGSELSWELAGMDRMVDSGPPLFIEWHSGPALHPGAATAGHDREIAGISWVEIGGEPELVSAWPGPTGADVRLVGGPAGVHRVGLGFGESVLG